MIQWHRFVEPAPDDANGQGTRSSLVLHEGNLTVTCGGGDVLVGISGDATQLNIHLNGEAHQYERKLVQRVHVNGGKGNHDIELADEEFDMLVVAHGERAEAAEPERDDDLHAARAQRRRKLSDDFGLV
jgi:hypothetical protein